MKQLLYGLFIVTACASCKSKTTQQSVDSTTVKPMDNSAALIKEFKPIVQGVWVKQDYLEKVNKTKSPLAAVDLANGLTTMYINTDLIKGDSARVNSGWGNHDGSEMTLKFQKGKRPSTIIFGGDDLGYSITGKDTLLVWYRMEKGQKTSVKYIKAMNRQPDDLVYGISYLINKSLIAGKYTYADNMVLQQVEFTPYGKITGFNDYKTYNINIDLNSDQMDNLDEIGFDRSSKSSFTFKIKGDTLKLYDTRPNADSTLLIIDKLRYQLIRKK